MNKKKPQIKALRCTVCNVAYRSVSWSIFCADCRIDAGHIDELCAEDELPFIINLTMH